MTGGKFPYGLQDRQTYKNTEMKILIVNNITATFYFFTLQEKLLTIASVCGVVLFTLLSLLLKRDLKKSRLSGTPAGCSPGVLSERVIRQKMKD